MVQKAIKLGTSSRLDPGFQLPYERSELELTMFLCKKILISHVSLNVLGQMRCEQLINPWFPKLHLKVSNFSHRIESNVLRIRDILVRIQIRTSD